LLGASYIQHLSEEGMYCDQTTQFGSKLTALELKTGIEDKTKS